MLSPLRCGSAPGGAHLSSGPTAAPRLVVPATTDGTLRNSAHGANKRHTHPISVSPARPCRPPAPPCPAALPRPALGPGPGPSAAACPAPPGRCSAARAPPCRPPRPAAAAAAARPAVRRTRRRRTLPCSGPGPTPRRPCCTTWITSSSCKADSAAAEDASRQARSSTCIAGNNDQRRGINGRNVNGRDINGREHTARAPESGAVRRAIG